MDVLTAQLHVEHAAKPEVGKLVWFEEEGYGYLPVGRYHDYGDGYAKTYIDYDGTTGPGMKINRLRTAFVDKWIDGASLVDIGIGSGSFIIYRNVLHGGSPTRGYDIGGYGLRWLYKQGFFHNVLQTSCENTCFWDSLEHLSDAGLYLPRVEKRVFVSMPTYEGKAELLASKHYKPGEHIYYFSPQGLEKFMVHYGFRLLESNHLEEQVGREGVTSFVFERRS